ncbi:MAG: helix-turn-helix transcriptional regulator [Anaerolineales bacterium]
MADERLPEDEPIYVISVAARLVCMHPQTLRYYDRIGLMKPSRTVGRTRLYSRSDIERLRKINRLTDDLGVNLAGVEVILNMSERIEELQQELERTREQANAEIERLKQRLQEASGRSGSQEQSVINVRVREITDGVEEDVQ